MPSYRPREVDWPVQVAYVATADLAESSAAVGIQGIFAANCGRKKDVPGRNSSQTGRIRTDLVQRFHFAPEQVHLTGMTVLYNNMLQSLFRSRAATFGFVFVVVFAMFIALFRSVRISAIALAPNLLVTGLVLGLMGWLRIPLDIMTITIASIAMGIAVVDTIHYIHRFETEFAADRDYWAATSTEHALPLVAKVTWRPDWNGLGLDPPAIGSLLAASATAPGLGLQPRHSLLPYIGPIASPEQV